MQVEPGESDVFDAVPFLEIREIWCDEGLIDGVLDPVRGWFVGRGHGRGKAMGWRAQGRRFSSSQISVGGRIAFSKLRLIITRAESDHLNSNGHRPPLPLPRLRGIK